ncbi:MAG: presqualene diphosphate synthase HpnD [Acetobacteraceae bacterium]|nr:presqualene diphosphate synthase HpnD [Acetobacteraceae bacterium]
MTGADPADLAAVDAIVRASGTSFYRGMAVLAPDRRNAMYAIYAFCRIVDDIADDETPFETKKPRLDAWRARIAALYAGQADEPVTRVLKLAIAAYDLRQIDFQAVIDGMQTDAETTVVAPNMDALDLYCDQVASAVGRLSVRAFGDASDHADIVAYHLGRALQLTNILRDIAEDAGRDRLYLPRELLEAAKIPLNPAAALVHPALPTVCAELADIAQGHFEDAAAWMDQCDKRAMKPARLMGATYAALLQALRRAGWRNLHRPVKLSKLRKLWLALRYGLL